MHKRKKDALCISMDGTAEGTTDIKSLDVRYGMNHDSGLYNRHQLKIYKTI